MGYESTSSKDSCSYSSSSSYSSYEPTSGTSKIFVQLSKAIEKREKIEEAILVKQNELVKVDREIELLSNKLQEDKGFSRIMVKYFGPNFR